jgi:hypothetical protein
MDNIVIKDLTMHFCDISKNVIARRKRVGLRPIMGKIFRFCNFKKPYSILEPYEANRQIIADNSSPKNKSINELERLLHYSFSSWKISDPIA